MKSFLDLCKSRVDAELIYNLSSLYNCDILNLFLSDWSNMAIIEVSHPYVILFMLLIGFIYFGMYFLSDVSPIHTFPSAIIAPKKHSQKLVILYHCVALVLIFDVDVSVSLKEYH